GTLMDVVLGRQRGADVQDLPDADLTDQELHDPPEERPVRADSVAGFRRELERLLYHRTVGRKVVLTAKQVVVGPGWMCNRGVDAGREPVEIVAHTVTSRSRSVM